jgi:hypothetical protein
MQINYANLFITSDNARDLAISFSLFACPRSDYERPYPQPVNTSMQWLIKPSDPLRRTDATVY